jgi:hypothetical protein
MTDFHADNELDLADLIPELTELESDDVAYIKREIKNLRPVYGIYDSEGHNIGYAPSRQVALVMIHQAELIAQDVN